MIGQNGNTAIFAILNNMMLLQEYKESWVEDFGAIQTVIAAALLNLDASIEHVGSTAVPGLSAKPVIDIDIVYSESVAFDEIKNRLAQTGYKHHGNQGIAGREVFKRDTATAAHSILDAIAHHLYACRVDSEELQRHILFRDYLRKNEAARMQYQHLKYETAAAAGQDRKQYAQLKEERAKNFITTIITRAAAEKAAGLRQSENSNN
jgi:GrpB-like predicted nucleotidyltransferase (UPF0157 family)